QSAARIERAAQVLLAVYDRCARFADVGEHPVAELQERFACRRDLDLASEAEEERLVQFLFQQEDLPADGRLRDMEPCTGSRERASIGQRADDFELSEIHGLAHSRSIFASASPAGV